MQAVDGRRKEDEETAQQGSAAQELPRQASSRLDSAATPRGIGRPPVRDHNMLMNGVQP